MKIGILTFHCAHNYGAVLQCYALQELLKSMGHDVKVIDYRPDFLLNPYKIWNIDRRKTRSSLLKRFVSECLNLLKRWIRYEKFSFFIRTRLDLTKEKGISSFFDAYIMGSDQIWNPLITKGFHKPYLGYFEFPKNSKKYIAYAASMETSYLDQEAKDYYAKALSNFDAISVREQILVNLLQPLTKNKIHAVLDPTLLVHTAIWSSITICPSIKDKYVLIYQVRVDKNVKRIAQSIADQIGAKVIEIASEVHWRYKKGTHQCCSPGEFLGWIKNASCIVTTSFHGTAFSVIFNKPFYCLKLGKGDTRIDFLLHELGMEKRMIDKNLTPNFQLIDYQIPNSKLVILQKKSYQYLVSSLGS